MFSVLKRALPDHAVPMRVWRGPFRGARVMMNPRASLRKAMGLYEHELNPWLEAALRETHRVLDVGANDGYFTFGCAAAYRRLRIDGEIFAYEAQPKHVEQLRAAIGTQPPGGCKIDVTHAWVGASSGGEFLALDDVAVDDRRGTLIKLDVEGAEEDVIAGARSWLLPENRFVIEVHRRPSIDRLRAVFHDAGLELQLIEQQPLPILGAEVRDPDNWWLVSTLGSRT